MLLGAIADDFTGATDLCSMLVRGGMRTVQLIGVPRDTDAPPDADAVVVALKSRTAPVREAVQQSLAALAWLRRAGCRQFFFKYCSTFDSTDAGQYRPGRRRADPRARLRLRARLPRVSHQRAHRLSGPSVRRRHAAERERHGAPSADADDRCQPGARARPPDRRHGWPGALRHCRTRRCRRHPRRHDGIEGARPALCDRRCGERRASAGDRRSGGRACADHRRFRRRDGAAGEFPSRGIAAGGKRCRRVAACRRPCRGARRFVLARDTGAAWHRASHLPVWQLDPLATPDAAQACGGGT